MNPSALRGDPTHVLAFRFSSDKQTKDLARHTRYSAWSAAGGQALPEEVAKLTVTFLDEG